MDYTDGDKTVQTVHDVFKQFEIEIKTKCFAVKMEELWDSDDVYCYPDRDMVERFIPNIKNFTIMPSTTKHYLKQKSHS